ncbi:MAG: NAD-dependent epimerase/dehydratase family protein [Acidimicrobiales bacterium]
MVTGWSPAREFWAHRRVAVTGATGFLGSHLVGYLVELGAEVVILVRDTVPASSVTRRWTGHVGEVHGGVEDQRTMERLLGEYQVQTLFHLAAQSQVEVANRNPVSTFEANIVGTWTALEAARRSPTVTEVLVASSDKAYGDQHSLPYDEAMSLDAVHPYDVSKACTDLLARSYGVTFGLPVVTTRFGNFYGPGDTNWNRLVPGVCRAVIEGRRPLIRSDGTLTRDYIYVVDAALAYLRLAECLDRDPSLGAKAFNFSCESPISVLDLVGRIQATAGTSLEPIVEAKASGEIQHQYLSSALARRLLGWEPAYSMDEALAETLRWYRRELEAGPAPWRQ